MNQNREPPFIENDRDIFTTKRINHKPPAKTNKNANSWVARKVFLLKEEHSIEET
jgi:hypothetical protein